MKKQMTLLDAIKIIEVCYDDPDNENDNCDGCPVAPYSGHCKKHLDDAIETINNWKGEKMKKPMKIEEALALVTDYAATQYNPPTVGNSDELRQAADILRNMAEEPVWKRESGHHVCKCCNCFKLYAWPKDKNPIGRKKCPHCKALLYKNYESVIADKITTETRVLKIVPQKTDVKFEEVEK